MKVLLNSCVSHLARQVVQNAGHDVTWVVIGCDGDEAILRTAECELALSLIHAELIRTARD
jgi:hypothetical protein